LKGDRKGRLRRSIAILRSWSRRRGATSAPARSRRRTRPMACRRNAGGV